MASSFISKHNLKIFALFYMFIFPWIHGNADEYQPQIGAGGGFGGNQAQAGGNANQYQPQIGAGGNQPQTGGTNGNFPQPGAGGADEPAQVVEKALICFNNNYVYSSCQQAYRLTESGNINVPEEYTDQFCNGPCLSETHLVLNCVDNILSHFLFYNGASVLDVKATIAAGCSNGPQRGNFNVAEHMQAEENSANKGPNSVLLGLLLMIIYMRYNLFF